MGLLGPSPRRQQPAPRPEVDCEVSFQVLSVTSFCLRRNAIQGFRVRHSIYRAHGKKTMREQWLARSAPFDGQMSTRRLSKKSTLGGPQGRSQAGSPPQPASPCSRALAFAQAARVRTADEAYFTKRKQ